MVCSEAQSSVCFVDKVVCHLLSTETRSTFFGSLFGCFALAFDEFKFKSSTEFWKKLCVTIEEFDYRYLLRLVLTACRKLYHEFQICGSCGLSLNTVKSKSGCKLGFAYLNVSLAHLSALRTSPWSCIKYVRFLFPSSPSSVIEQLHDEVSKFKNLTKVSKYLVGLTVLCLQFFESINAGQPSSVTKLPFATSPLRRPPIQITVWLTRNLNRRMAEYCWLTVQGLL